MEQQDEQAFIGLNDWIDEDVNHRLRPPQSPDLTSGEQWLDVCTPRSPSSKHQMMEYV